MILKDFSFTGMLFKLIVRTERLNQRGAQAEGSRSEYLKMLHNVTKCYILRKSKCNNTDVKLIKFVLKVTYLQKATITR